MGQETRAMDIDRWKSVLWSDESKFEIFGSNRSVFVRRRVGERMISACVVPTVKHGGGGVMEGRCIAGDTASDLFRIQGTLNQHGYHNILQRYAIPSGFCFLHFFLTVFFIWLLQSPDLNPIKMV